VRATGTAGQTVTLWAPAPVAFEERYAATVLETLGYRARVKTVPAHIQSYFQKILDSRTRVQGGYIGWNADYPSSLAFFKQQFSCGAFVPNNAQFQNGNFSEFCSPRIDTEITRAAAVQVQDPPAAVALWQQLERDLLAQAPVVPAYNGRAVTFLSKRVGNFQYNPQWGTLLDQLWVK
jgi:peptide/nickel transport system substrate-binding protein